MKLTKHQLKYINPNAKKWIIALKSGKYKQTQRMLRDPFGHCCLGVGLECYVKFDKTTPLSLFGGVKLKSKHQSWLGLRGGEGQPLDIEHHALTYLNDTDKRTFNEIADHLLNYPEQYFIPRQEQIK